MSNLLTRTEQQALYQAADMVMEYATDHYGVLFQFSRNSAMWSLPDRAEDACHELFGFWLNDSNNPVRSLLTREQSRDLLIALAVMGGPRG